MRHRKRGRRLGRSASHRKALLRNLASSLFLTERDAELDENPPKVRGRIITTMQKAKEVQPLVEKCITIARHALEHEAEAERYATDAERYSDQWRRWRGSTKWQQWNAAISPAVAARRRALRLLGNKQAVRILFDEIAPRFEDREGGYTRVVRLATPRLGDAGTRAILELVGVRDRTTEKKSEKPAFEDDEAADVEQTASELAEAEEQQEVEAQAGPDVEGEDQQEGADAAADQAADEGQSGEKPDEKNPR